MQSAGRSLRQRPKKSHRKRRATDAIRRAYIEAKQPVSMLPVVATGDAIRGTHTEAKMPNIATGSDPQIAPQAAYTADEGIPPYARRPVGMADTGK